MSYRLLNRKNMLKTFFLLSILYLPFVSIQFSHTEISSEGLSSYQPEVFFTKDKGPYVRFLHDFDYGDVSGNEQFFIYQLPNQSWSKAENFWGNGNYEVERTNFGFSTYNLGYNLGWYRNDYFEELNSWVKDIPLITEAVISSLLKISNIESPPEPILWVVRAYHSFNNGTAIVLWDYLDTQNSNTYHMYITMLDSDLNIILHKEITENLGIPFDASEHPWFQSQESYRIVFNNNITYIYQKNYSSRISSEDSWSEWKNTDLPVIPNQKIFNNRFLFRVHNNSLNIIDLGLELLAQTTVTLPQGEFQSNHGLGVYINDFSDEKTLKDLNLTIFWLQPTQIALWSYSATNQSWYSIATKNHEYNGSYFDFELYSHENLKPLFRVDLAFHDNTYYLYWDEQIAPFISEIFQITYETSSYWSSITQITSVLDFPNDHFHGSDLSSFSFEILIPMIIIPLSYLIRRKRNRK